MVDQTSVLNEAAAGLQGLAQMQSRIILHAGENSVVDNTQLPHLDSDRKVILTNNVYETLKIIIDGTNVRGAEVPFLLFGDYNNSVFVFDSVYADVSDGDNPDEANFSRDLQQKVFDFGLGAKKQENKVVAHGHSHPQHGKYYLNFSLSDMRGYFGMRRKTWLQNVMVCGCLLTGGNFNFVFCDGKDVYRIDNVYTQNENGQIVRLPSFGPDVATLGYGRNMGR